MEAAREIWDDLSDRRGFGFKSLKHDDPDVYEKIIDSMATIIAKHFLYYTH